MRDIRQKKKESVKALTEFLNANAKIYQAYLEVDKLLHEILNTHDMPANETLLEHLCVRANDLLKR